MNERKEICEILLEKYRFSRVQQIRSALLFDAGSIVAPNIGNATTTIITVIQTSGRYGFFGRFDHCI
jgi:hypothetical protein